MKMLFSFVLLIFLQSFVQIGCAQEDTAQFIWPTSGEQTFDTTAAGRFFEQIFAKYSDEYFSLNSEIGWRESFSASGYHFTSSFKIVDSTATGNARYLLDVTPEEIKATSDIRFYKGMETCHYELSINGLEWRGFAVGDSADFIYAADVDGYSSLLMDALAEIKFKDRKAQEQFALGLLFALTPDFVNGCTNCTQEGIDFYWVGNELKVTQRFSEFCNCRCILEDLYEGDFKKELVFQFQKNRIASIVIR